MTVLLLDKDEFPRDKVCGDGIAPHVLDVLARVGVRDLLADKVPVWRISWRAGVRTLDYTVARPTWIVPRLEFDARLVREALAAGACLVRHRARQIITKADGVLVDDQFHARVVIGADGAHSRTRVAAGVPPQRRWALAIRGYAPPAEENEGAQVFSFERARQPRYAWSFDTGDGLANIGYGQLLHSSADVSRGQMLDGLRRLMPEAVTEAPNWRAHHLPLSHWSWHPPDGRLLLAGDAAGLVNPLSGEGIYHAVVSGARAGRCAAEALLAGSSEHAGARHRAELHRHMSRNLRHTTVGATLASQPTLLAAALMAAARDPVISADLLELGLGHGVLRRRDIAALLRAAPHAWTESRRAGVGIRPIGRG